MTLNELTTDALIGPSPEEHPEELKIRVIERVEERGEAKKSKTVAVKIKVKLRELNGSLYHPDAYDWSFEHTDLEEVSPKGAETVSGEIAQSNEVKMKTRLYEECDGHPFYVESTCPDESCVEQGIERKIFNEWKKQFMAIHKVPEGMFSERILISDVSLAEGPKYVFWRVDYVFHLDWVRSRQSEVVNLGKFPLPNRPDSDGIARFVSQSIRRDRKYTLDAAATRAEIESAFKSCAGDMKIDWCHIDFENRTGRLLIRGIALVPGEVEGNPVRSNRGIRPPGPGDPPEPECIYSTIAVETGKMIDCTRGPCWIH